MQPNRNHVIKGGLEQTSTIPTTGIPVANYNRECTEWFRKENKNVGGREGERSLFLRFGRVAKI
jgi:hypothetical protein